MEKTQLIRGKTYRMVNDHEGNKSGTEVVFHQMTEDGKWAVCNPVDEPSMQDAICLDPEVDLEELG